MKTFFIAAFGVVTLFTSCSTYRGTQTPDDMYYASSPKVAASAGRNSGSDEYVQANSSRSDGRYDQSTYNGYDDYATPDDRWLMMRVRDRARWSVFDNYNYFDPYMDYGYGGLGGYGLGYYSPYAYSPGFSLGMGNGFYSPYYSFGLGLGYGTFGYGYFNNYYNWNSFYNPYFYNSVVASPKLNPAGYTTVRNFNLGGYTNRNYNVGSRSASRPNYNGYVSPNSTPSRIYYNNNRQNNSGNNGRVYSNNATLNNGGYNRSNDRPVRTYAPAQQSYTPRSSGVSSGGYSGGGGGNSGGGGSTGSRPSRR